jgi:hypothetical protein
MGLGWGFDLAGQGPPQRLHSPPPGEWVTYTDPLQRAVDDLVRKFDPGGYELQCPIRGCDWRLFVPRMELDPEPLEEETGHWVVDVQGVPREDLELVLRGHIDWHAHLTETGAADVPPAPVPT